MQYLTRARHAIKRLWSSHSFQLLFLSSLFAISLSALRILYVGSPKYFFLNWNIFLAAIPWLLSRYMRDKAEGGIQLSFVKTWSLRALWLLFLPNAPYILTDLYHLRYSSGTYLWYDALLILSYAWAGLLFGLLSIRDMEINLRQTMGALMSRILIPLLLFLSAFGIYIGRFQRWNSWDVLTNPHILFLDVIDLIIHPMSQPVRADLACVIRAFKVSRRLILMKGIKLNSMPRKSMIAME